MSATARLPAFSIVTSGPTIKQRRTALTSAALPSSLGLTSNLPDSPNKQERRNDGWSLDVTWQKDLHTLIAVSSNTVGGRER